MRWEKVEQPAGLGEAARGPGKLSYKTCNTIKRGRYIYAFGGYDWINRCYKNQVDVFDTANSRWSRPLIKGTRPDPRDSHTCTTVKDNLFVFGGRTWNHYLNDLYVLDTSTTPHTWIQPPVSGQIPEAREDHTATLVNNYIFIFGGSALTPAQEVDFNDLYMLNTETFKWTRPQVYGNPPSPRAHHTCSLWNQKLIVMCGIVDENSNALQILSDFHVLDTNTMRWDVLQTLGDVLTARTEHAAVSLGEKLFVFGGLTHDLLRYNNDLYMIDLVSRVWSRVNTLGESPSERFSASGLCLNPYKNGVLVFMGGTDEFEDLDDMYYLHTGSLNDSKIDPNLALQSQEKQRRQSCKKRRLKPCFVERKFVTQRIPKIIDEERFHGVLVSNTQNSIEMSGPSFSTEEDSLLQTEKGTVVNGVAKTIDEERLHGVLVSNTQNSVEMSDPSFSSGEDSLLKTEKRTVVIGVPKTIDEERLHGVLVSNTENSIEMFDPSFNTGEDSLLETEKGTVVNGVSKTMDEERLHGVLVLNTQNSIEMFDPSFSSEEDSLLETEKGRVDAEDTNTDTNTVQL